MSPQGQLGQGLGSIVSCGWPAPAPQAWSPWHDGRPAWLSSFRPGNFAPWAVIDPSTDTAWAQSPRSSGLGPLLMPTLARVLPRPTGSDARRREHKRPDYSRYAAWLRDIACLPHAEVATELDLVAYRWDTSGRGRRAYTNPPADLKQAQRYEQAGRRLLRKEGVLPWVAWPDGGLPSEWWKRAGFAASVEEWVAMTREREVRAKEDAAILATRLYADWPAGLISPGKRSHTGVADSWRRLDLVEEHVQPDGRQPSEQHNGDDPPHHETDPWPVLRTVGGRLYRARSTC